LPCSDDWLTKIQLWVDQWEQADELLVHPTGPHIDSSFRAYLIWYLPRTRARLVYVDTHPQPHQARPQDGYARHHVEALAGAFRLCNMMETDCSTYLTRVRAGSPMTQFEQTEAWSRQRDQLHQVVHNLGSHVQYDDSHGSSQASSSFPCPSTVHGPMSQFFPSAGYDPATACGHTGMFRGTTPVGGPYPRMVPGPQIPAYTGFYPDAGARPSSSSF